MTKPASAKKKPAPDTRSAKSPAKARTLKVAKPVRAAEPTQFEFGKLLDVVERQSAKASSKALRPDEVTRAAIEAIVRKESELIRKAMKKERKSPAWVRQQWKDFGKSPSAASDDCTPEQYAEWVRQTDRAVPPPGPVRTRLLEAGRKLKS